MTNPTTKQKKAKESKDTIEKMEGAIHTLDGIPLFEDRNLKDNEVIPLDKNNMPMKKSDTRIPSKLVVKNAQMFMDLLNESTINLEEL